MKFLVVNDDGIQAVGIKILAETLKSYGDVTVVAPDGGRSAAGHSIVMTRPLDFKYNGNIDNIEWYQTDGTPADCVRLALDVLDEEFDIVFSGVNNGLNLGTDVIYSGTCAAAREAHIGGVASVAISTDVNCFDIVKNELNDVLNYIFNNKLYSKEYTLNINFPTKLFNKSLGFKFANQGVKRFKTSFIKNEMGKFVENGSKITYDQNPESDVYLASQGYVTFVPLKVEQTNYVVLNELKK